MAFFTFLLVTIMVACFYDQLPFHLEMLMNHAKERIAHAIYEHFLQPIIESYNAVIESNNAVIASNNANIQWNKRVVESITRDEELRRTNEAGSRVAQPEKQQLLKEKRRQSEGLSRKSSQGSDAKSHNTATSPEPTQHAGQLGELDSVVTKDVEDKTFPNRSHSMSSDAKSDSGYESHTESSSVSSVEDADSVTRNEASQKSKEHIINHDDDDSGAKIPSKNASIHTPPNTATTKIEASPAPAIAAIHEKASPLGSTGSDSAHVNTDPATVNSPDADAEKRAHVVFRPAKLRMPKRSTTTPEPSGGSLQTKAPSEPIETAVPSRQDLINRYEWEKSPFDPMNGPHPYLRDLQERLLVPAAGDFASRDACIRYMLAFPHGSESISKPSAWHHDVVDAIVDSLEAQIPSVMSASIKTTIAAVLREVTPEYRTLAFEDLVEAVAVWSNRFLNVPIQLSICDARRKWSIWRIEPKIDEVVWICRDDCNNAANVVESQLWSGVRAPLVPATEFVSKEKTALGESSRDRDQQPEEPPQKSDEQNPDRAQAFEDQASEGHGDGPSEDPISEDIDEPIKDSTENSTAMDADKEAKHFSGKRLSPRSPVTDQGSDWDLNDEGADDDGDHAARSEERLPAPEHDPDHEPMAGGSVNHTQFEQRNADSEMDEAPPLPLFAPEMPDRDSSPVVSAQNTQARCPADHAMEDPEQPAQPCGEVDMDDDNNTGESVTEGITGDPSTSAQSGIFDDAEDTCDSTQHEDADMEDQVEPVRPAEDVSVVQAQTSPSWPSNRYSQEGVAAFMQYCADRKSRDDEALDLTRRREQDQEMEDASEDEIATSPPLAGDHSIAPPEPTAQPSPWAMSNMQHTGSSEPRRPADLTSDVASKLAELRQMVGLPMTTPTAAPQQEAQETESPSAPSDLGVSKSPEGTNRDVMEDKAQPMSDGDHGDDANDSDEDEDVFVDVPPGRTGGDNSDSNDDGDGSIENDAAEDPDAYMQQVTEEVGEDDKDAQTQDLSLGADIGNDDEGDDTVGLADDLEESDADVEMEEGENPSGYGELTLVEDAGLSASSKNQQKYKPELRPSEGVQHRPAGASRVQMPSRYDVAREREANNLLYSTSLASALYRLRSKLEAVKRIAVYRDLAFGEHQAQDNDESMDPELTKYTIREANRLQAHWTDEECRHSVDAEISGDEDLYGDNDEYMTLKSQGVEVDADELINEVLQVAENKRHGRMLQKAARQAEKVEEEKEAEEKLAAQEAAVVPMKSAAVIARELRQKTAGRKGNGARGSGRR
ncbi:hypothetical protein OHC33_005156 [Knufia fluminis]|uniref:Uncharacterized protein n=1 Tax=Knufia fluminis TaxID=191047 RepID=A0AAN8I965_9EURO|nr:hypothetical protein OHC33_005156 [Knufia fluminis]